MMNHDEAGILIERYLDGDLSPEEKKHIEYLIDSDEKFRDELDLHIQLRRTFSWSFEQKALREKMEKFHKELGGNHSISSKSTPKNGFRTWIIAASVSLLITTGALATYHFITMKAAGKNVYATLNRTETSFDSDDKKESSELSPAPSMEEASDLPQNVATAFVFTTDGYLLTNYHVVAGKKHVYIEKFQDTLQSYVAEVISVDEELDVALLKINDPRFVDFSSIPFVFSSQEGLIGQKVFTLGYPKNDIVYSEGPVSSLTGYNSDTLALQLSLAVNPGNSGAPVFTENGEIVGMIMGKNIENDGEAYGVKINHIIQFINASGIKEIQIPSRNLLRNKKVTDQVNTITPYVFIIRA